MQEVDTGQDERLIQSSLPLQIEDVPLFYLGFDLCL